jgi:hypothetical protein
MSLNLSLEPEIFGTFQPEPDTLTTIALIPEGRAGHVTVFITNNQTVEDRVRLLLQPALQSITDAQYILYDTLVPEGYPVYIGNVFVNSGDQIVAYSQLGAVAFTISGTAFVYS